MPDDGAEQRDGFPAHPSKAGWTEPEAFAALPWWERRRRRRHRLREAEWAGRAHPGGEVIVQLRERARTFEGRALWVLAALILTVALGLAYYVALPFYADAQSIHANAQREVLGEQIAARQAALDKVREDARAFVGEVITRLRGFGELFLHPVPGVTSDLTDVALSRDDEIVIIGANGTALARPGADSEFIRLETPDLNETLNAVAFGPHGEALIVSDSGAVLTRHPDGDFVREDYAGIQDVFGLCDLAFSPKGEAVIVGAFGTILTRSRVGDFVEQQFPLKGGLIGLAFGASGEAVAVGSNGTVLIRPPEGGDFLPHVIPAVVDLYAVAFAPDGQVVIVGYDGLILARPAGGDFVRRNVPGVSKRLTAVAFDPKGEGLIVGFDGTVLSRAPEGDFVPRDVPGVRQHLWAVAFGPNGEPVIVGANGTVLTKQPEIANRVEAVGASPSFDIARLEKAMAAIPEHAQDAVELTRLAQFGAEFQDLEQQISEQQSAFDAMEQTIDLRATEAVGDVPGGLRG